ncbi:cyclin-dependent kinase 4 inhibitor C isoform X1 [Trematomus bernacchii]|uniref:cyclin-dependent kinase 4 inhibitor C isoform X1 n=1 Tax=Trematomus bernacchii TaxID=40690 RepID=UPI00146A9018|nr:cyclin-dependent kinase 4 inhibitor C isoform X1 [Trematomus bernacchii]
MSDELSRAAARGEIDKVLELLQNGADVNGFNQYKRTALQVVNWACPDVVEALLSAGAEFNIRDPVLRLTPLHDAARAGYIGSVQKLVLYGADVNLCDEIGNLPLHLAAMEGNLEVIRLLIGRTADPRARSAEGCTAGQLAHLHQKIEAAKYIEDYLRSN